MDEVKVLATVAGRPITDSDVDEYIYKMPQEQRVYATNPYFREQVLQQLISTKLYAKLGEDTKVEETEEFKKIMDNLREQVLAQLAVANIMDAIKVTEDEAKAYYAENGEQFIKGETVGAKHILMDCEGMIGKLKERIAKGETTFEDAAKEYSTCPSKAQGGDLGEFGRGQMVPEFEEAAFNAEVGELVGPVKTQFGVHLIQVYKHNKPDVPAFEEAKDQIMKELLQRKQQEAYQNVLADLKAKYVQ